MPVAETAVEGLVTCNGRCPRRRSGKLSKATLQQFARVAAAARRGVAFTLGGVASFCACPLSWAGECAIDSWSSDFPMPISQCSSVINVPEGVAAIEGIRHSDKVHNSPRTGEIGNRKRARIRAPWSARYFIGRNDIEVSESRKHKAAGKDGEGAREAQRNPRKPYSRWVVSHGSTQCTFPGARRLIL